MDDTEDELDLATIELTARIEQTMGNFSYNLTRRSVDAAHEIIDRYAKLFDIRPTDLEQELAEETALREKLDDICTRTVNALKGKPPENVLWSWHDLPELATQAMATKTVPVSFVTEWADRIAHTPWQFKESEKVVEDLLSALGYVIKEE
jgi:hypothetical protein